MIIKKLEIQGFKSFPERTKVLFHPGITAIVGPNGTGKSNIVDAILWGLGGHRQKGLRGDKVEDIIFNGNAKRAALGMADVSLAFGDEHEEETIINHRVFRSGESEYRLNGKPARLKDIQDVLWKRAVVEKEYFVIEQGAIGTLLSAKPAEKRMLLEEAAGTAFYKDRKKEAQSKLASSEQNLVRLEDIIAEVARAKNSLQRQAQAAVRYRKLRERSRELAGLNFLRRLSQLERRHAEAAAELEASLNTEHEIGQRLKAGEKELTDRRREIWDLEKTLKEGQEALFAIESQLAHAEGDKDKEAKRIEFLAERARRASASAADFRREMEALAAEVGGCEKDRAELGQALSLKIEDLNRGEASYLEAGRGATGLESAIAALKAEQLDKLSALTEARNEALKTGKELELEARREAKLKAQIEEEKVRLAGHEQALAALKEAQAETERRRTAAEIRLEEARRALELEGREAARLESLLAAARKAKDEDGFNLQAIQRMIASQGGEPSDEVGGALGRLADLVDVDPEAASLVDALWAEEADTAVVPAAEFLREAMGRGLSGKYLLLAPSDKDDEAPAIDDPRVLGRLKSRLRPGPRVQGSVGRLPDAVIVSDIAAAVELWLGRPGLNFLTPGGDLLLASGLLRLGRKGDGVFVLHKEMKRLEDRLREREAEIGPLAAELETHRLRAESLETARRESAALLDDLRAKFHEQEKALAGRQAERDRAVADSAVLEKELAIWDQDDRALRQRLDSAAALAAELEVTERGLRDRLAAEESSLLGHRERHLEDEKRFISLRAEASLLEERRTNLDRRTAGLIERRDGLEKRIRGLEDEARSAAAESDEARRAAAGLESRAAELEVEKKERHDALSGMDTALQQKRTEASGLDQSLAGLREELEKKKEDRIRWEISRAEIDRDMVNLEETCWQELKKTLHEIKAESVATELSDAEIEEQLAETEEDLQRYKSVNLMAEEEYAGHKERHDFLTQQQADLRASIDATQEAIRKIDDESQTQFLNALTEVNKNFQEVFTELFKGGSAEVRLMDAANPMDSGVEIIAQPPGKKVQHIMLLSGGEKSLTSIAFMFALFRYKPTPFCIMDEVDAALDDVNLTRFLDLMKNIKSGTQFIIITHNYKSMEVADYIYGTTMAEPNYTTLYSMKLDKTAEPEPVP